MMERGAPAAAARPGCATRRCGHAQGARYPSPYSGFWIFQRR
jgi:hypothetical protein